MTLLARYNESLGNIPPPGCGCHSFLLTVANLGIIAGVKPQMIFTDIRKSIPNGSRYITDREISEAIEKGTLGKHEGQYRDLSHKTEPPAKNPDGLRRIVDQGRLTTDGDLFDASPYKITWGPEDDTVNFLSLMFDPDDHIFIGDKFGTTVKTTGTWIEGFRSGGKTFPHIVVNPLSGLPIPKKDGSGTTMRSDANVKTFKYCLVEFDDLSREDQIKFWSAAKLPIVALIDSAKKSIHAWIDAQKLAKIETSEDWLREIKIRLYQDLLSPLGVDRSCANPARLSRLPGHKRDGIYQRLLWISQDGRPIL